MWSSRSTAKAHFDTELFRMEKRRQYYEKTSRRESFAIEMNLYNLATYKSFQGLQACHSAKPENDCGRN